MYGNARFAGARRTIAHPDAGITTARIAEARCAQGGERLRKRMEDASKVIEEIAVVAGENAQRE